MFEREPLSVFLFSQVSVVKSRRKETFGVGDRTAHKEGTSAVSSCVGLTVLLVYLKARVAETQGFCPLPAVTPDLKTRLDVAETAGSFASPI